VVCLDAEKYPMHISVHGDRPRTAKKSIDRVPSPFYGELVAR
jgi:hypothetical protein